MCTRFVAKFHVDGSSPDDSWRGPQPRRALGSASRGAARTIIASVPGPDSDVAVFEDGAFGGTAVLHGMLATLAEVLDRLEGRLADLETAVARPDTRALEARLAAVEERLAPVADRLDEVRGLTRSLARLEAAVAEGRAEVAMAAKAAADEHTATGADHDLGGRLADRVAQLQEAVNRSRGEATSVIEQVGDGLGQRLAAVEAAVAAVAMPTPVAPASDAAGWEDVVDRVARVESLMRELRAEEDARATRLAAELQSSVAAGMERLLANATAVDESLTADLRAALHRLGEVASTVDGVGAGLDGLSRQVARLTGDDRLRPVLDAMEATAREQQEALAAAQAALVRRIDGRTSALARLFDGTGELGPLLGRLATAVDGFDQGVTAITRRQGATLKLLEQLGAELGDEHRRLEAVQSLCQSVAAAVEQQAAVGGRVAELVLETRAAMRGDVERLESTVQLETVKSRQQDQARLAQATAGVTEVVEREATLVAQRVAAVGAVVEAVRASLLPSADEVSP